MSLDAIADLKSQIATAAARLRARLVVLPSGAGLERGIGERREDCRLYNDCLHVFVHKGRGDASARCPTTCSAYAPTSREKRYADATAGGGPGWSV